MPEDLLSHAVSDAADALHDAWRRDYRAANGDVPRWKPLNDKSVMWLGEHPGTPSAALRVNTETGKNEIDIAALSNRQLPPQYSGENTAAASGAIEAIRENPHHDTEHLASTVHDQWLSRNGSWAPESQKVPYASLPEAEKAKDRVVVEEAHKHLERHFPQGLRPAARFGGVLGLAAPVLVGAVAAGVAYVATGNVAQAKTAGEGAAEDTGNLLSGRKAPGGPQSGTGRAAYKAMDYVEQVGDHAFGINEPPTSKTKLSAAQQRASVPIARPAAGKTLSPGG